MARHAREDSGTCPFTWGFSNTPEPHTHMCRENKGHTWVHLCVICEARKKVVGTPGL